MKKLKNALNVLILPTRTCNSCFSSFQNKSLRNFFNPFTNDCDKCFHDFSIKFYRFLVEGLSCLSLYDYDDYFKNKLYLFKGCYDIALRNSFLDSYITELSLMYLGYTMVPIPSYFEDDMKRGFNHVEEIFSLLKLKMMKLFIKTSPYKQADQSFDKRVNIKNNITFIDNIDKIDKKILLVDDVITSGNTLKCCINLLKERGVKDIKILTLSASKHLNKQNENMLKKAFAKIKKLNKMD